MLPLDVAAKEPGELRLTAGSPLVVEQGDCGEDLGVGRHVASTPILALTFDGGVNSYYGWASVGRFDYKSSASTRTEQPESAAKEH